MSREKINTYLHLGEKATIDDVDVVEMLTVLNEQGMVDAKAMKQQLWSGTIEWLKSNKWDYSNPHSNDLYNGLHKDVYIELLSNRCASFLSTTKGEYNKGKSITDQDILHQIAGKHPLNLEKEILCQSVRDLNTLHRANMDSELNKCMKRIDDVRRTNNTFNTSTEVNELRKRLERLDALIKQYDKESTYSTTNIEVCMSGGCTDKLHTLHKLASEITRVSKSCSSDINRLLKSSKYAEIKNRERTGQKVGLFEKTQAFLNL